MIDIPWTLYNPTLYTDDSGTDPDNFSLRRAEFRVIDDWCQVQYTMRGNDDIGLGHGYWCLGLPVYGLFDFSMDNKIYGRGAVGFDGSPTHKLVTYHGYETVGCAADEARYCRIAVDEGLFLSSGMSWTPINLHAQLAYRVHPDADTDLSFDIGVEDAINDQHPGLL